VSDTEPEDIEDTGTPSETPLVLSRPSALSWATSVYDAVLSPTDAARRAAAVKMPRTRPGDLRRAVGRAQGASLASDYAQLADTHEDC
jgi:hypothetical protein